MDAPRTVMEVQSYSFRIGKKLILNNLSFSIEEGEYLTIIGPNGAGKTTLLRCLDRIYTSREGVMTLYGRRLDEYSRRDLSTLLSYVPQADWRYVPFTVNEFVMMGRYPHLSPFSSISKKDRQVVHHALMLTGTDAFADRNLNTLSGGERQKVFIAAALAQEARVLLLDEPTTFLDPKHQGDVNSLLSRLNRTYGITIISVTHDINSAAQWSDRILALRNGRMHYLGRAELVMSNNVLEHIYEKSFLFVKHPQTGLPVVVPDGKAP